MRDLWSDNKRILMAAACAVALVLAVATVVYLEPWKSVLQAENETESSAADSQEGTKGGEQDPASAASQEAGNDSKEETLAAGFSSEAIKPPTGAIINRVPLEISGGILGDAAGKLENDVFKNMAGGAVGRYAREREEGGSGQEELFKTSDAEAADIQLTEEEERMIKLLYDRMKSDNLSSAAALLNSNEKRLSGIYSGALGEKEYLYDGEKFTSLGEGTGLVLKRHNTAFFGSFKNGAPEGACTAILAVVIDYPRYDYSKGLWKNGRMEGAGTIGYRYYSGTDGTATPEVKKEGVFVEDLMDGEVTYSSTNSQGVTSVWKIEAADGVTKITEEWSYNDKKEEYRLLAQGDDNHAFVIREADVKSARWANMVRWAE